MEAPDYPPKKGLGFTVEVGHAGIGASTNIPRLQTEEAKAPEIKFSEWLPEPPADPILLRRLARVRWEKGVTAVVLIAMWTGLILGSLLMKHGGVLNALFQLLAPLSVMLWLYVASRRASPQLADLLDLPPVCPQFPVEIIYRANVTAYGKDQGIVGLFDGWMHFQGRRTSWSLSTKELKRHEWAKHTGNSGVLAGAKTSSAFHTFKWTDGKDKLGISMYPMDRIEGLGGGLRKKFDKAIEPWFDSRSASPDTMMFPPNVTAPGLARRQMVTRSGWICVRWASLLFLTVSLMACFGGPWPWWWPLIAVFSWLCVEIVLAYVSKSLAAVNQRSLDADRVDFQLPEKPWWVRMNFKL